MFLLSICYVPVIAPLILILHNTLIAPILMLGQLREKTNNLLKVTLANKKLEEA